LQDHRLIAELLKFFFIKLPEPLLTFDLYDDFISTSGTSLNSQLGIINDPDIEDSEFYTEALCSLVYRLPKSHRVLLQYLVAFLNKVANYSEINLMTTSKLAKVFG
jgi:hypothetical protein